MLARISIQNIYKLKLKNVEAMFSYQLHKTG